VEPHLELIILGLLVAVAGLGAVARVLDVPYPILLVLGGLVLGFAPGIPSIELPPELVLLIFLPPLLYGAAFFTSLRDLRADLRPIALLSIGLVIATMLAVAAVVHEVVGLPWPVAFVLGAIVSPSDAVAPATILRQLGVPRRLLTIVEGENLTNDWTALVLYRFAVMAVATSSFSFWEASGRFVLTGLGGVAVGLIVGRVMREVRRRIDDPPIEITISLLSGYAAYLPAEALGVSGVIAAVTVGIYMGWHAPKLTTPIMRIQGASVWEIVQFLLNAVLFLLIGLQMPVIVANIAGHSQAELLGWALLISAVVIGVRLAWQFTVPYLIRAVDRRPGQITRRLSWQQRLVLSWCGMRGAVSLAAALALPLETDAGTPFPERDLLIFLSFAAILATLVGQGLTLKHLIVRLHLEDDGAAEREDLLARVHAADAALARLEQLAAEDWVYDDTVGRVRAMLEYRHSRFASRIEGKDSESFEARSAAYQRLLRELLAVQRRALLELRNEGRISDEVRRRVERDLDFEESRLED
jgi:CPA1 family monovalent cation:H+ antiporter